jgi:hypothetical protein
MTIGKGAKRRSITEYSCCTTPQGKRTKAEQAEASRAYKAATAAGFNPERVFRSKAAAGKYAKELTAATGHKWNFTEVLFL